MHFYKAKQAFTENAQRYLSSKKDGATWNTNAGLLNLTEALEFELSQLRQSIQELEKQVQQLARASRH
mgnify:CR=1 FL=1